MMKVLHLVKTTIGAGWALRQMRELVKLGAEVHVAVPDAGGLSQRYREHGIIVHVQDTALSVSRPQSNLQRFRQLRRLVEQIKPDLVHSHFVQTTLAMRLALRGYQIPRLFQVPGPLHLEHGLFKRLDIASSTADDYWVASCQWTRTAYLEAKIAPQRVFLSFYGGDIPEQMPQKGQLRRELNLPDDVLIVGMVAFMYAPKRYLGQKRGLKGHEDLIDALAICRANGLPVHGVFVGGAWGEAHWYEEAVRAYGQSRLGEQVSFLGTRHDVPSLYMDFDLAVHPSHSENLGGAAESLMWGIPTIATNVGGFPDIVIPEQSGWLVPAHQPQALAQTIQDALADPTKAKQLALVGQGLVRQALDVRHTAQQIYTIYQDILARKQAHA